MATPEVVEGESARKTFTCENCWTEFQPYRSPSCKTVPRFCSQACRRTGVRVPCSECGADVYRRASEMKVKDARAKEAKHSQSGATFCSPQCRQAHYARTRVDLTCAHCGKMFTKSASQLVRPGRGQFCSRECCDLHGLEEVGCSWPGCDSVMVARRFDMPKSGVEWKLDLRKHAPSVRWPFCPHHVEYARRHLPAGHRLQNGKQKWLVDPATDLGHRGITGVVTRLMIWAKTDGTCASCKVPLPFDESPRTWNIDHKVPVFKGGLTNYWNLEALCADCHRKKSAGEKSEATLARHREIKGGRYLTHPEKDAVIVRLHAEIAALREELKNIKEFGYAPEDLGRRVSVRPEGLRQVRRHRHEGGQGSLFVESG